MVDFIFDKPDNTLVCTLNGHFGTDVNEVFSSLLSEKIVECRNQAGEKDKLNVTFDLKTVNFISSSFIRTCIAISRQLNPGNFTIINASAVIKKTFKIAGLDEVLNVT